MILDTFIHFFQPVLVYFTAVDLNAFIPIIKQP